MKLPWVLPLAAFMVSLVFLAGPAFADDQGDLKTQIQQLFDQVAADFQKGDLKAVLSASAPNAVIVYKNGQTIDMVQWEKAVEKDVADWQNDQTKYVVEKAWPIGEDQAGAVYSESHEFTRSSDPGHKYAILAQFQAKLTKTAQGWRFLEFQEISIQTTKDGQPLSPEPAK